MVKNQDHTKYTSEIIQQIIPSVKGLVLVGGKSSRMRRDKSELQYHQKPQKQFAKELLETEGIKTYYSVSKDQGSADEIHDTISDLGPIGGIISAFQKDSSSAWFVIATDLPFLNNEVIKVLLERRDPSKVATAVKGKRKEFPEPLVTIYEPKAYPIMRGHIARGDVSPRKILDKLDIKIVEVDDRLLQNINTPEEYKMIKKELT